MAETLISPGVLARENDSSQITSQPVEFGAALITPAVLGPVQIPTLVTSFSEYEAIFGSTLSSGSGVYSYLGSVAANNYFSQGGTSLLVSRVVNNNVSASVEVHPFTQASSTRIQNNVSSGQLKFIDSGSASDPTGVTRGSNPNAVTNPSASGFSYSIAFGAPGATGSTAGTSYLVPATSSLAGTGAEVAITLASGVTGTASFASFTVTKPGSGYVAGETITINSASLGATSDAGVVGSNFVITLAAANIQGSNAFTLNSISEGEVANSELNETSGGALVSGSANNVRWEITAVNTSSGVFSLAVRRGNDRNQQKVILETFNNISLDPSQVNYVEEQIGNTSFTIQQDGTDFYVKSNGEFINKSKYIRVNTVNSPTYEYFDNNGQVKNEFTSSLPIIQSGSFTGATGILYNTSSQALFNDKINANNIQGVLANDYTQSIKLLSNKDAYNYNILVAPGLNHAQHPSQVNLLVSTAEARQDCISIIDLRPYGATIGQVVNQVNSFDSSYASTYWPWLQTVDPQTARTVWVPASTFILGTYAFTDASADPWFAPAGLTRGALGRVIKAERRLTAGNRDELYEANVNPIATFPGQGVVVFGQKTLQKQASALDRVNVRRLLIALKSFIVQVSDNLVFEQNTLATRNNFLTQVNPYLESVQQRQGLFAFKVVMDDSNNTPDVIDRNQLVGQIFLQPTKTAEFIILDFNVLPTGATFPS